MSLPPKSPPRVWQGPVFEKMNNILRFFSGRSSYSDVEWAEKPTLAFPQICCEQLGLGHWTHFDNDDDLSNGSQYRWVWSNVLPDIHAHTQTCRQTRLLKRAIFE